MKLFSAAQIREWDQYTILHEPIDSVDLMERAALAVTNWLLQRLPADKKIILICGTGNNGGDGLAVARMLLKEKRDVSVFILKSEHRGPDCQANLVRLQHLNIQVAEIDEEASFPSIDPDEIIIEALFGTGLNKILQNKVQKLIEHINQSKATVISIDIPAGLFADAGTAGNTAVHATHTLSFQSNKLAFMFAESEPCTGSIHLLDIGLHPQFYQNTKTNYYTIDKEIARAICKRRKKFSNKYTYGHVLLYAGSPNMMGAAILCAKACLRSGAGLVTIHTPESLMHIIQTALPEAIAAAENNFTEILKKKNAVGIGPGMALTEQNSSLLKQLILEWNGPLVIDASALSLLKPFTDLLQARKNHPTVLTPHAGEFEKLFGKCSSDYERLNSAMKMAAAHQCYIVLKGYHTLVACPDGEVYFNTTGNSGMATAGSGDVLTGILTGLLAQGYAIKEACLLGVYLHGLAGDFAAAAFSEEAMIAGDITEALGKAYKEINSPVLQANQKGLKK